MNMRKTHEKKPYSPPRLVDYGCLRDLTLAEKGGQGFDNGGSPPYHKNGKSK